MTQKRLREIPATPDSLVLRTDFSDEATWKSLCQAIEEPQGDDHFKAYVNFVSDRHYEDATVDDLLTLDHEAANRNYLFVVDKMATYNDEYPILVLDVNNRHGKPGRSFRVIPSEMWGVENNLSISNLDFEDFANNADLDGVFRGFK